MPNLTIDTNNLIPSYDLPEHNPIYSGHFADVVYVYTCVLCGDIDTNPNNIKNCPNCDKIICIYCKCSDCDICSNCCPEVKQRCNGCDNKTCDIHIYNCSECNDNVCSECLIEYKCEQDDNLICLKCDINFANYSDYRECCCCIGKFCISEKCCKNKYLIDEQCCMDCFSKGRHLVYDEEGF